MAPAPVGGARARTPKPTSRTTAAANFSKRIGVRSASDYDKKLAAVNPNFTAVDTQMYTLCAASVVCSATGHKPTVNQLVFNNHFGLPRASSNTLISQRQIQVAIKLL